MSACGVLAGEITEITLFFTKEQVTVIKRRARGKRKEGAKIGNRIKKMIIHLPSIQVLMSLIKAEI